jgi:hypothetical protein
MVSIRSLQRFYDQLKEINDDSTESQVALISLERAVDLSIPAISNFYAVLKEIAENYSLTTQKNPQEVAAQAPKLKRDLNSILHETHKKLRVAKAALIDSMIAAKMPCTILETLFLSEPLEYRSIVNSGWAEGAKSASGQIANSSI